MMIFRLDARDELLYLIIRYKKQYLIFLRQLRYKN